MDTLVKEMIHIPDRTELGSTKFHRVTLNSIACNLKPMRDLHLEFFI
jgi:hypothetical protein